MSKRLGVALCLLSTPARAQVEVGIRTEKASYLAGEPVFILVDIRNVGDQPMAYGADEPADLRRRQRQAETCEIPEPMRGTGDRQRSGWSQSSSSAQAGSTDDRARSLLRGYRLTPGSYELRVSGHAGVHWAQYPALLNDPPAPKRKAGEPIQGAVVDRTLPLDVVAGSQAELEAAYKPYVAVAMEVYSGKGSEAARAIFEMAPPFLEAGIVKIDGNHRR
jgi:hypothetical protein